jgi:hypothetical protein
LNRLRQRKELLLRTSDLHRATLQAESVKLREAASWVDLGLNVAQQARTVWNIAVPFLAARRTTPPQSTGLLTKLARGFAVGQAVTALWRQWRGKDSAPPSPLPE